MDRVGIAGGPLLRKQDEDDKFEFEILNKENESGDVLTPSPLS